MKTKHSIYGLAALSLIFLTLSSCQKDPAAGSGLGLKVQAKNSTYTVPVKDSGPGSIFRGLPSVSWDKATMAVSQVTLEATPAPETSTTEKGKIERTWLGPMTVDLFNLSATLGKVALPAGSYGEIEFEVQARQIGSNPSVLYLAGVYTNLAGKTFPLVVDITDEFTYTAEKHNVVIPAGTGSEGTGLVKVYLDRLFSSILPADLEQASLVNGTILISAHSNPELYALIMSNLGKPAGTDPGDDGTDE